MDNEYFRSLSVELLSEAGSYRNYEETDPFPSHKTIIQPLLKNSFYGCVFGLKKDSALYLSNADILISDKGKFRFDLSKECVAGHEYLWNVRGWERGSIIILLKNDVDFSEIFKHTYRPSFSNNPNAGNSLSAIKKCKAEAALGNVAICFPASNGSEWMQIYATGVGWERILQQAEANCQQKEYYL
ncbi:hypothetical protein [Chitinophaga flava]|uniref:Uncharacterized protein n=1 Tax=Chitinophaga flava TaxID=2259036 RepID=A0A365XTN1_9BACT|nr:hypothetical protein [Chitinophaga flava]RBL89478.1 hypothetical protein DF182_23475 [Chitinophaga flava]